MTTARVLVAGVGNIFLGDDGFGPAVVRRLEGRMASDVRVADFGIRGFDLAYALLEGYELVILVDATRRGGLPGTLYVLEPTPAETDPAPDTHGMVPARALQLARALGAPAERLLLVACEPDSFGEPGIGRMELSAAVGASVEAAARLVEELVQRHMDPEPVRA